MMLGENKLKSKITLLGILLIGILATITSHSVGAVDTSQFNAGDIIENTVFYNSASMSPQDIQTFLNNQVPVCDTNGTASTSYYYNPTSGRVSFSSSDSGSSYVTTSRLTYGQRYNSYTGRTDGGVPYICLKDYSGSSPSMAAESGLCNAYTGGTKSAAQMIYDVGVACGINPQVLLVLLEKEQGLVTDTWPQGIQYQSATGYGCPDGGSCNPTYYGIFNQIYYAARQYKLYAKNISSYTYQPGKSVNIQYNPDTSCGSSSVYIQNQATADLYIYTPYQPNAATLAASEGTIVTCGAYGNLNFWRKFNEWFGSTTVGPSVSPLYKSDSSPTIYAISGNTKYPMASFDIINAYGLGNKPVNIVFDSFLSQFVTGPTISTTIAKKANDPNGILYLFDAGKRYPITINACKYNPDGSAVTSTTWAIDCFNTNVVNVLANPLIDNYTVQDIPVPAVILYNNSAWKIEAGTKRRITDPAFVSVLGGWENTRWMATVNASQPEGQLLIIDGSTVKFDNGPTIYLLNNSKLYPAPGSDEYASWSLSRRNFVYLPASYNGSSPIPVGSPLTSCVQDSQGQYYLLTLNGLKVALTTSQYSPTSNTACSVDLDTALNAIGGVQNTNIYRSQTGDIMTIRNGKRYVFPTSDDILSSGFQISNIQQISSTAENLFSYDGLQLSLGRLFKVTGSDIIRYVSADGQSLSVNSTNIPGLPYSKLITVDTTTGSRYPIVGSYN